MIRIAAIAVCFALAGCGGREADGNHSPPSDPPAPDPVPAPECIAPPLSELEPPADRGARGEIDLSFGVDGRVFPSVSVEDVEEDRFGRLLVVGGGSESNATICRHDRNGAADPSFGFAEGCASLDVDGYAQAIALDGDRVLVAGTLSDFGVFLARLLDDGTLDPSFADGGVRNIAIPGPREVVDILRVHDDIVVAGSSDGSAFVLVADEEGNPLLDFGVQGVESGLGSYATDLIPRAPCGFVVGSGHRFHDYGLATYGYYGTGRPLPSGAQTVSLSGSILSVASEGFISRWRLDGEMVHQNGPDQFPGLALDSVSDGEYVYVAGTLWTGESGSFALGAFDATGHLDPTFADGGLAIFEEGIANRVIRLQDGRLLLAGNRDGTAGSMRRIWN